MKKLFILTILVVVFGGFATKIQAQRKCGTMEYLQQQKADDPTLQLRIENYEQALQKWIQNNQEYINSSKSTITVPVVVHIVYNTAAQNISDARVLEQINIMNADYAGLNAHSMQAFSTSLKVNTELQFCLAQRTPAGAATTGIERRSTTVTSFSYTNDGVKYYSTGGLDAWNPAKYMNIWVCNLGGGLCGYAQFPTGGLNSTFGVVINYQYFGKTGAVAPYNLGGTTTHEIGHCFNLFHIWGDDGGACTGTDYCTDIPNQANYTYGAHTGVLTDACTSTSPGIQYMNFMDYSDDTSYANFTPNQKSRIAALFVSGGLLYSLSVSDGCTPPAASCGTPSGLAASSITTTTATLSWSAVSGAVNYNIQYRPSGSGTFITTSSTITSAAITGLTPNTTYEFQIQAVCTVAGSYSGLSTFTTMASCGTPSGLADSSITATTATLSWLAVSGATNYNIQYRPSGSGTYITTSSTSTSVVITGLTPNTTYEFQVQAVCTVAGSYSGLSTFTTAAASCGTPSGLAASSITMTSATLSWSAVSGAVNYNIQYRPSGSGTFITTSSTITSAAITGLTPNTTYEYQVQAVCTAAGSYSVLSTFTTMASCGTPSGLADSSITTTTATLSWLAVSGATNYNIQYRPSGSGTFITTSSTITSVVITGLTPNTTYEFQVQAVCTVAGSYSGLYSFTTAAASCGTPSGLAASSITTTSAALNWSAVSGAINYNIQYRPSGSGTFITTSSTITSVVITGLTPNTTYEFQVQAVCTVAGSYSGLYSFTTAAASCGTPSGLAASSITTTTATLSWSAVSGAINYNIQYRPSGSGTFITTSSTITSVTITGLTPNTTYEFQVQAVCTVAGSYSGLSTFTTIASCGTPSGLAASSITTTTATLSWSAVSGAINYNIQYRPSGSGTFITTSSTITSVTITGLTPNTTYEFQIQAVCTVAGSYSGLATFTTMASCGTPSSLAASSITTTSATLNWTAVSGATSYNIQYRPSGTSTYTTTTSTTNSKAISGLTAATTYEFQVQAICTVAGIYSGLVTFTTLSLPSCTDNYETNNTAATAKTITVNTAINALIGTATDVDYFKFSNISSKKNIKVTLTNLPYNYDLKLYKSNGTTLIATSQNLGTTSESITYNNAKVGTYIIKVYGYNNAYSATSCYTLNASISSSSFKGVAEEVTENNTPADILIFPNPANENLNVSYNSDNNGAVAISIYDVTGRVVSSATYPAIKGLNNYSLNVSDLSKGIYVFALKNAGTVLTEKLVIDK